MTNGGFTYRDEYLLSLPLGLPGNEALQRRLVLDALHMLSTCQTPGTILRLPYTVWDASAEAPGCIPHVAATSLSGSQATSSVVIAQLEQERYSEERIESSERAGPFWLVQLLSFLITM